MSGLFSKPENQFGEPVTIEDAYEELTPSTFAAFVKLSAQPRRSFERPELRDILGLSRAQATRAIKELRLVGYIKIKNRGRGRPSVIQIYRRIWINRIHMFVFS